MGEPERSGTGGRLERLDSVSSSESLGGQTISPDKAAGAKVEAIVTPEAGAIDASTSATVILKALCEKKEKAAVKARATGIAKKASAAGAMKRPAAFVSAADEDEDEDEEDRRSLCPR